MAETISTINKAGEDYNTLTLWEDAKDGDITAGNAEVAECYDDDGLLVDDVECLGWTTDIDSYIAIRTPAAERHNGTVGSGFIIRPNTHWTATVYIRAMGGSGYAYVEGLIVDVYNWATDGFGTTAGSGDKVFIRKNIVYTTHGTPHQGGDGCKQGWDYPGVGKHN